jgi:hypothetical protein
MDEVKGLQKTLEDIRARINELEAQREALEQEEEKRRHTLIAEHIDTLLLFFPEHGRTSCSDEDPGNRLRCDRCALLAVHRYGFVPTDTEMWVTIIRNRRQVRGEVGE